MAGKGVAVVLTEKEYGLLSRYVHQLYTGAATDEYTKHFRALGYIRPAGYQIQGGGTSTNPTVWAITPAGLAALQVFEEVAKQHAEDERQRRFQNKISVLNVLVPLATFFLGLLVEHYAGLVALLFG